MKRFQLRVALILALAAILLTSTAGIHAQDENATTPSPPQLGIVPLGIDGSYWDIVLKPGSETELSVQLRNFGERAERARVYPANVTTRVNGGMEIAAEEVAGTGATSWISLKNEELGLEPGAFMDRSFTVRVPADASPGQYLTSIVIQTASPIEIESSDEDDMKVNQILRQAIAVAITVPGNAEAELTISDASYVLHPGTASVQVAIANTGALHLRPEAEMTISNLDGTVIAHEDLKLDTIYARTSTFVETRLLEPLQPGNYVASLSLNDAALDTEVEATELPFTVEHVDANGNPITEAPAIAVDSVAVNEFRDDASGALQGVELVVGIDNPALPITNARLTLHVTKDGEPVEDFVLGSSLSFPGGTAEFRQRYLPLAGWTPGVWSFSVTLDVIDPATGDAIELSTVTAESTVTVP